jgi:predicted DNA binding CopG/RHH family protein
MAACPHCHRSGSNATDHSAALTVRLSESLRRGIQLIAADEGIPVSDVIRRALKVELAGWIDRA